MTVIQLDCLHQSFIIQPSIPWADGVYGYVYMYVHIYTHTYIYICMYVCVDTHTHTRLLSVFDGNSPRFPTTLLPSNGNSFRSHLSSQSFLQQLSINQLCVWNGIFRFSNPNQLHTVLIFTSQFHTIDRNIILPSTNWLSSASFLLSFPFDIFSTFLDAPWLLNSHHVSL